MKLFPNDFSVNPLRRYLWEIKPRYLVVDHAGLRKMMKIPEGYRYCGQAVRQALWCYTPLQFVITDWLEGKGVDIASRFVRWARRTGFLDIPFDGEVKCLSDFWKWDFWNHTERGT